MSYKIITFILWFLSLNWLDFFMFTFWFSVICFFLNCFDVLTITLYSEIIWVIIYCYIVIVGIINDDLILISTSFFVMALAGLEFCVGFVLAVYFKNFKKTFSLFEKPKKLVLSTN